MIKWDPSPELFPVNIPFLGRPLLWYGFLFALGFFCAYLILLCLLRRDFSKERAKFLAEKLCLYVVLGTIIGAKIGDLLFYQEWSQFKTDPLGCLKIWERGLASHGGVAGIFVSLLFFVKKYPEFSWKRLLDWVVVPAGLVGAFIRVGNFINQEILGKVSDLPWAVRFGHPLDGSMPVARHPVQLYEALFYLFIFGVCLSIYLKKKWKAGKLAGFFLLTVFTFRFGIEFFKEEQSSWMPLSAFLDMGQLLSVPLVLLGGYLFFSSSK